MIDDSYSCHTPNERNDTMSPTILNRDDYERWARDLMRLKAPTPTEPVIRDAHRVNVIDATPTMHGIVVRAIAMSGGSIDLYLNAAQAIHLFRALALAGIDAGWMDENGRPTTEPPTADDLQTLPGPIEARAYLRQRG